MLADINLDITRSCHDAQLRGDNRGQMLNTARLVFMILHLHRQHFKHTSPHDKWGFLNNKIKISYSQRFYKCDSLEADGANELAVIS